MKIKPTYLLIFGLFFISLILVVLKRNLSQKTEKSITPLEPGKTPADIIIKQNPPFLAQPSGASTVYYTGDQQNSNYTTYNTTSGELDYYIDRDPKKFEFSLYAQYANKYGKPDLELWGPWGSPTEGGYKSYIFLNPALIIIAHPISGTITQVWHIQPNLSVSKFEELYNDQFSTIQPTPQRSF